MFFSSSSSSQIDETHSCPHHGATSASACERDHFRFAFSIPPPSTLDLDDRGKDSRGRLLSPAFLGNKNRLSRACFPSPWRRLMRLRVLHFDVVMTEKLRTKVIYSMDGALASVLSHVCVSSRSYVHHYSLHLPHLPLNSLTSK